MLKYEPPPKRRKILDAPETPEPLEPWACSDISGGQESVPIRAINCIDGTSCFGIFCDYITNRVGLLPHEEEDADCDYDGCECKTDCFSPANSRACSCHLRFQTFAYDETGQLISQKSPKDSGEFEHVGHPVFECNSSCTCPPDCGNRVIQRGISFKLEVVKTAAKGWSVIAGEKIPAGRFVCEYVGEVISLDEARRRWKDEYAGFNTNFILVYQEKIAVSQHELLTVIDPTRLGNVARFINHSCDPNLDLVAIRIDSFVPHIAMFSLRDIEPGEELSFHYGTTSPSSATASFSPHSSTSSIPNPDSMDAVPRTPCLCGAETCSKWLPFDPSV